MWRKRNSGVLFRKMYNGVSTIENSMEVLQKIRVLPYDDNYPYIRKQGTKESFDEIEEESEKLA